MTPGTEPCAGQRAWSSRRAGTASARWKQAGELLGPGAQGREESRCCRAPRPGDQGREEKQRAKGRQEFGFGPTH